MSEYLDRAIRAAWIAAQREMGEDVTEQEVPGDLLPDVRMLAGHIVRELLKDISWDDIIEQEAQRLFKDSERERGAVRPQVIMPEDGMDYWTMVATIAEIRRRAGIGEG